MDGPPPGWVAPLTFIVPDEYRQMYVTLEGRVGLGMQGSFTNTDPRRRTWVFDGNILTLQDGSNRQLYVNTKGESAVAEWNTDANVELSMTAAASGNMKQDA